MSRSAGSGSLQKTERGLRLSSPCNVLSPIAPSHHRLLDLSEPRQEALLLLRRRTSLQLPVSPELLFRASRLAYDPGFDPCLSFVLDFQLELRGISPKQLLPESLLHVPSERLMNARPENISRSFKRKNQE